MPLEQNSPQKCPLGLYAEQISGSAFTRPREVNYHSWVYRFIECLTKRFQTIPTSIEKEMISPLTPNPLRWSPFDIEKDRWILFMAYIISQAIHY